MNNSSHMIHRFSASLKSAFALSFVVVLLLSSSSVFAQNIREENLYVKMGQFWMHHHSDAQTSHMYKEVDGELVALSSNDDRTSQFRIMDLLDGVGSNDSIWFTGVSDIRIIENENGDLIDQSAQWQYTEMVHHMVIKMLPTVSNRTSLDPCGNRIWPIATGSELTPFRLDLAGSGNQYAMHWKGGDEMAGAAWHFNNPGGLGQEQEVFIRFTLRFDVDSQSDYDDVNVSWVRGGGGCSFDFCLEPGDDESFGPMFTVPRNARLVMAVPHVHDHAIDMSLYRSSGRRTSEIIHTEIANSQSFTAAHHCAPDGEMIMPHTHSGNATGHLPFRGLADQVWDRANQFLRAGDRIYAGARFSVPHHGPNDQISRPIDAMAIYILFWDELD